MVGLAKIHETVVQVEQLQTSLAHKRKELNDKNEEANLKLKQMVHDQQEAEKKRISSQELQVVLAVRIPSIDFITNRNFYSSNFFSDNKSKLLKNEK